MTNSATYRTLVLNADYRPISTWPLSLISATDAVKAVFRDRAETVAEWDAVFRSPSVVIRIPKVIALRQFAPIHTSPKFCRRSILLRDRYRCQYCGNQADLLHQALQQLGVVRPVVVGHSWGAIVAMAMAVRYEADIAGVVALSGYYFWTLRPDVLLVGLGALPGIGDILRYTVSPLLNWLTMPLVKRALFSPGPVPARFNAEFSTAMAIRPSQIRATSEDGALMIPGALALRDHYRDLTLPVVIMAGEGDKVVFKRRAEQLKASVKGSMLYIVQGAGHMIHHQATQRVAEAVEAVAKRASDGTVRELTHNSIATLRRKVA